MPIDLPINAKNAFLQLKAAQKQLCEEYKGFTFTLDGKLIGDLGEAIVIRLLNNANKTKDGKKGYDIVASDGTKVQVKTTQKNSVGLGIKKETYEHLIVVRIYEMGQYEIIFDGPGSIVASVQGNSNLMNIERLRGLNNHNSKRLINN